MNARTRAARQTLRTRSAETRLRASLNRGRALATHVIATGVQDTKVVEGVVSALRTAAKRIGVQPVKVTRTHRTVAGKGSRTNKVYHFTARQVARIAAAYKPRKAEYKDIAAALRLTV